MLIPNTFLPGYRATARSAFPGNLVQMREGNGPGGPEAASSGDHAAASIAGHVTQAADWLASTRARRAAVARDIKSAGIVSPGAEIHLVRRLARNAEWGSTRLCSST